MTHTSPQAIVTLKFLILKKHMTCVSRCDMEQFNQLCYSCILSISDFLTLHITFNQPNSCFSLSLSNSHHGTISISLNISCKKEKPTLHAWSKQKTKWKKTPETKFFWSLKNQSQKQDMDKGNCGRWLPRTHLHFNCGNAGFNELQSLAIFCTTLLKCPRAEVSE